MFPFLQVIKAVEAVSKFIDLSLYNLIDKFSSLTNYF
jgi:hypothetical protein